MLRRANKPVCHCEKMQASLRASIFEAILHSLSKLTLIYAPAVTLCRIASLIRSKILAFQAQNFFSHSLAMTPAT